MLMLPLVVWAKTPSTAPEMVSPALDTSSWPDGPPRLIVPDPVEA